MSKNPSAEALAGLAAFRKAENECYRNADPAMAELFAEDIILTANGADNLIGRAAMLSFLTGIWTVYRGNFIEIHDDVVVEAGNYLFVTGRFTDELTPLAGGDVLTVKGRYQIVLVKADHGRYLLWREAVTDTGAVINK
ncbi:nuclear transport factor 2 family protein [Colwelliaceae bacterium 6441]